MGKLSANTNRMYLDAQEAFRLWCRDEKIRFPASHMAIACYLIACAKERGPNSMRVHLAAIAHLYRAQNRPLDTRSSVIQEVLARYKVKKVKYLE